jgi:hypothetical protein
VNPFTVIDLVALVAAVDGSIEMIAANAPAHRTPAMLPIRRSQPTPCAALIAVLRSR